MVRLIGMGMFREGVGVADAAPPQPARPICLGAGDCNVQVFFHSVGNKKEPVGHSHYFRAALLNMNLFDGRHVFENALDTSLKTPMRKNSTLFGVGLICGLTLVISTSLAADKKIDTSKLPPVADKKGLTFDKDIKPILEKSCVKCHGAEKPKSKYRTDSVASLIKGGDSGEPAVVPGHSDKSPIVHYVSDLVEEMEMPPTDKRDRYPALTKQEVGLLRAWIDQGAK